MIKRVSFLCCVVIMVVSMLAVPAFAAEVQEDSSIKIVKQPEDVIASQNDDDYLCPVVLEVVVEGDVSSYKWEYSRDDGKTWLLSACTGSVYESSYWHWPNDDILVRCTVTGSDGTQIISRCATVEFIKARPLRFVSSCLTYAADWVGTIVNSLVLPEGDLYPLLPVLAIGIAVTAVLLFIKIYKSFSWGL